MEPEKQSPDQTYPHLLHISEPLVGAEYPLMQDIFTLGRASDNHLAFPGDDSITRHHARILKRLGLLWLEDLDSTNGSFICPPGGVERRLLPHTPAILTENSYLRLGLKVRLQVRGTIASPNEATRTICQRLQYMLLELNQRVRQLPSGERKIHLDAIHNLEKRLAAATSEEEMALLAIEGIEELNANLDTLHPNLNSLVRTTPVPELPPLPDELPDPSDQRRFNTIMNVFITDIRLCFPVDEDGNNDPSR